MDEFYTINQAAIVLKVHQLTVRRYIREGSLKAFRVGGSVRVAVNDLRNFTQSFVPHTKSNKQTQSLASHTFTVNDPLLRLKGRGISMSRIEQS